MLQTRFTKSSLRRHIGVATRCDNEVMYGMPHQYIDRQTNTVQTEPLYHDALVNFFYAGLWERAPVLYNLLTRAWTSQLLGFVNYDLPLGARLSGATRFLRTCRVNFSECVDPLARLRTARAIFERKIRYWECRPMPEDPQTFVSPADCRLLVGSLYETSHLFLKWKFFDFDELFGCDKLLWMRAFRGGDFVICRLTPEKYHYNHLPVAGVVRDYYQIPGGYTSCNPGVVVTLVTPYSKNKRIVTIIDTDVEGGSQVGLVAMIEVVALMIGDITQCYSAERYDHPQSVTPGLFLQRGAPKSVYRPGSSTTIVFFQAGRVEFTADLVRNMHRQHVHSRFSHGFGRPLVETDVKVRSAIAKAIPLPSAKRQTLWRSVVGRVGWQRLTTTTLEGRRGGSW